MIKNIYVKFKVVDTDFYNYKSFVLLEGYIKRKELLNLKNLLKELNKKRNDLYKENNTFHQFLRYSEIDSIVKKSSILKTIFKKERRNWVEENEDSICSFVKLDVIRPVEFFKN